MLLHVARSLESEGTKMRWTLMDAKFKQLSENQGLNEENFNIGLEVV